MNDDELSQALSIVKEARSDGCGEHHKSDSNVSKEKVMGGRDPEGITKTSSEYRIVKFHWICDDCGKLVSEQDIRGGKT